MVAFVVCWRKPPPLWLMEGAEWWKTAVMTVGLQPNPPFNSELKACLTCSECNPGPALAGKKMCVHVYLRMQLPCSSSSFSLSSVCTCIGLCISSSLFLYWFCFSVCLHVCVCVCGISSCLRGDWLRSGLGRAQHSWTSKAGKPFSAFSVSLIRFVFMSVTRTPACSGIKTTGKKGRTGHSLSLPGPQAPEEETGVCACLCVYVCVHARWGLKMQQCPLWFTFKAALIYSSRQEEPNLFSVCCSTV